MIHRHDIGQSPVIIGAGLAGLMTALQLAPRPAVVLAKAPLGDGIASGWAQGGIAAALGPDDDPELHWADTLAAGDGLVDPDFAHRVITAGPAAIATLQHFGVRFDEAEGRLTLGLEAAHGRHRIIHAQGDASGREIMRAIVSAVSRTPSITVLQAEARRLMTVNGAVTGILAISATGPIFLPTRRVVIATGGIGSLFLHTTNPQGAQGDGLALAARAGAVLADMEFIQFHPTALDDGSAPMGLVSEAVRGAGAVLVNETGARFMADIAGGELAPRDVVARAAWRQLTLGHRCFLDTRPALGKTFADRFPSISKRCLAAGIDPAREPIPVRPAAHFHMGGIAVDAAGRSSLPGLWACGEAASSGLHGANRLASNSLLEAVVCAGFVAQSLARTAASPPVRLESSPLPPPASAGRVPAIMSRHLGILRDHEGLVRAIDSLLPLTSPACPEADAALVALMIAVGALLRRESRGGHFRSDFPHKNPAFAQRSFLTSEAALRAAAEALVSLPQARSA